MLISGIRCLFCKGDTKIFITKNIFLIGNSPPKFVKILGAITTLRFIFQDPFHFQYKIWRDSMNYKQIRNTLEQVANENNGDFAKSLIRFEKRY